MKKCTVLHVDDSAVIRGVIRKILESDPSIDLVASARNGQDGVDFYKKFSPDVVIMDIEMPVMDGITALEKIIANDKDAKVIMCSTLSVANADITMRAMKIGAVDYIAKPSNSSEISGADEFQQRLLFLVNNIKPKRPLGNVTHETTSISPTLKIQTSEYELRNRHPASWMPSIIAVGSSTGGPQALFDFMTGLAGVNLPVVITQHMPVTFTTLLAKHISANSGFECEEAENGLVVKPGKAILARGGQHMKFRKSVGGEITVVLDDGPAENFCKPSVDTMYRSLIDIYDGKILSVMLTGMGHDGRDGTKSIVDSGGYCVAQDEKTSVVWGMPGAVATAGLCSAVLPLNEMAPWIKNNIKC